MVFVKTVFYNKCLTILLTNAFLQQIICDPYRKTFVLGGSKTTVMKTFVKTKTFVIEKQTCIGNVFDTGKTCYRKTFVIGQTFRTLLSNNTC